MKIQDRIDEAIAEAVAAALAADAIQDEAALTALRVECANQIHAALAADAAADAAQIATLVARIAELESGNDPDAAATIAALQAQIVALEAQMVAELDALADAYDAQIVILQARIAELEAAGPTDPDSAATIAALQAQVATLQARIAELEAGNPDPEPEPVVLPPFLDPEMIVKSWFQEDVTEGVVASWQSGGVKPVVAVQPDITLAPTKLPAKGGVLFKKGTQQALTWAFDNDAPYLHRWWLVIARADSAGNTAVDSASVLCVNGAEGGPVCRQPKVAFRPGAGTFATQMHDGTARTEEAPCSAAFADWNVLVGYRRGFRLQSVVNGIKSPGQTFLGLVPNTAAPKSFMGDINNPMKADVAIDCVILGQGELNDAQIDKLTGWAMWRVGRQATLPVDHTYRNAAPLTVDANDNPTRYAFDADAWATWAATTNEVKFAHRGEPATPENGYTTVFFDDFVAPSVVDDAKGPPSSIWYAPTHVGSAVGGAATAQKVSAVPSVYVHDAANHTMAIRLLHNGTKWWTGAFSSVNNNGQGRSWGKGIFEIRCKMPAIASPRPGFFPAFWSYGLENLFWRTRNRLETDFWEYDGLNGAWINITQHVHKPRIETSIPGIVQTEQEDKIAGYEVGPLNGFASKIDIYDGEFHTWQARVEDDLTYFNIDGLEVARIATSQELAAKKYIMVDLAYAVNKGLATPDPAVTYDMTIDYIKVMQKEADLAVVPSAFSALPSIASVSGGLIVTPNVTASQIEYLWYRDGVPVVGATSAFYAVGAEDAGHAVRCHVRAPSLLDQPEAWSPAVMVA
jgi:hypothetical protein